MLVFLIHNPEKFACDSLFWPGIIVLIKVITGIGAQIACIIHLLNVRTPLLAIKAYAIVSILASIDSKMLMMISNINTDEDIVNNPLEFNNQDVLASSAISRIYTNYIDPS